MTTVDLAVVGGGPVGVTMALLAAQRGLTVTLFEKNEAILDLPRAVGMDAEIQRVFQNAGLAEELTAITTPLGGAEFLATDGTRIIGHETPADAVFPIGHHPSVMYHQPWLEEMIRAAAERHGVDMRLGVEVSEVTQDDDGVTVTTTEGPVRATWLVAADGAGSAVRKSLGVAFVDQGFDQDWLVFDVALHAPVPGLSTLAQQICDPDRPTTVVPGHAHFRRWEFQLQPGESHEEMTTPERVWELIEPWLSPADGELSRAVVYRFHATVADRMRVGRVFLAGDAAHQMPPFLGQGLCSGIRDAANLAWKLAMVRNGWAGSDLLDSYDSERRPHASDVVRHAVDTGRLIDQLAGRVEAGVGIDAGYGGGREFPRLRHGLVIGDGPRVGKQSPQPIVNGRYFDEHLGPGFAIVVNERAAIPQDLVERWTAIEATIVELDQHQDGALELLARSVPPRGAMVIRPDRYVAAVAEQPQDLALITDQLLSTIRGRS